MTFKIEKGKTVEQAIRSIMRSQIDEALGVLLDEQAGDPDRTVHEVRSRLKRARAAWRLVQEAVGKKTYCRENQALRDAGRRLSPFRDLAVALDTLSEVSAAPAEFPAIRQDFQARHQTATQGTGGAKTRFAEAIAVLRACRERTGQWHLAAEGWDALGPGLARTYRRNVQAYESVCHDPNVGALHEWRKRVKDLWHQVEILTPIKPRRLGALAKQLSSVASWLGSDHDLAVLDDQVATIGKRVMPAELGRRIATRHQELRTEALAAGKRLYAESPKAFARRFEHYWQAWNK